MRVSTEAVLELIERQRELVVSVATGGPPIDSVDAEYKERRTELAEELAKLDLRDSFPWRSLWDWYEYYSENLPTYKARRAYVSELVTPLVQQLERLRDGVNSVVDWGSPKESWATLEGRLDGLKGEIERAKSLDDCQDVGRRARQIIIDSANLVFTDSMTPEGEQPPKGDDAKNRIRLYLASRLSGNHDELRKLMRDALDLAHAVTHSSSATPIDAFAVAQAAVLVVRVLQEVEREQALT
jgi:hypothetical protein